MAYKRGTLAFIFLLSAYSVYHFSSNHAESGFVHKMKRSMVGNICAVHMKLVHGLNAITDDGLNGWCIASGTC